MTARKAIEAALAAGPTDGPWIAAGPSFGAALPTYLDEVAVNHYGDDDETHSVCVCPIGLGDDPESSLTMDYISIVNPTAMREVFAAHDAELAAANERIVGLTEFASFVLRGCEAGHIKSKPTMNMDPNADSIKLESLADVARAALNQTGAEK